MLFWALLASGQINMRKIDGWQTLATKPINQQMTLRPDQVPSTCRRSRALIPTNIRDGTHSLAGSFYRLGASRVRGRLSIKGDLFPCSPRLVSLPWLPSQP
jgi:hypothetical protein